MPYGEVFASPPPPTVLPPHVSYRSTGSSPSIFHRQPRHISPTRRPKCYESSIGSDDDERSLPASPQQPDPTVTQGLLLAAQELGARAEEYKRQNVMLKEKLRGQGSPAVVPLTSVKEEWKALTKERVSHAIAARDREWTSKVAKERQQLASVLEGLQRRVARKSATPMPSPPIPPATPPQPPQPPTPTQPDALVQQQLREMQQQQMLMAQQLIAVLMGQQGASSAPLPDVSGLQSQMEALLGNVSKRYKEDLENMQSMVSNLARQAREAVEARDEILATQKQEQQVLRERLAWQEGQLRSLGVNPAPSSPPPSAPSSFAAQPPAPRESLQHTLTPPKPPSLHEHHHFTQQEYRAPNHPDIPNPDDHVSHPSSGPRQGGHESLPHPPPVNKATLLEQHQYLQRQVELMMRQSRLAEQFRHWQQHKQPSPAPQQWNPPPPPPQLRSSSPLVDSESLPPTPPPLDKRPSLGSLPSKRMHRDEGPSQRELELEQQLATVRSTLNDRTADLEHRLQCARALLEAVMPELTALVPTSPPRKATLTPL